MEDNILKKLCGKIDSQTYESIRKTLICSGIGFISLNPIVNIVNPTLSTPINYLVWLTILANIGMTFSHGCCYTKDINELRNLYQEFINNYSKLNKVFNLENPIEIYTMYTYLLHKGYLSQGKEFTFFNDKLNEIIKLQGVNVLGGKAVCRHISSLLTDILQKEGIVAKKLSVYCRDNDVDIEIFDEPKYSREELIDWINNHQLSDRAKEVFMYAIEEVVDKKGMGVEFIYKEVDEKNSLIRFFGNHAISVAFKDGKVYFLDATQQRIYQRDEHNPNILLDVDRTIPIKKESSMLLNGVKENIKMQKLLSKPFSNVSCEEKKLLTNRTLMLCQNNMDIFDKFYQENNELYMDVTNKLSKIKGRIF